MTQLTENLTLERAPLAELRPHPDNPRNGDTAAIMAPLEAHGQYAPLVVAREGTVLVGNHRYAAAAELGWAELDVIRLDCEPDDPEAIKIMLADNRTSDLGRYDDGLLVQLLQAVSTVDDTLVGTGYSPDDLSDLMALMDYREYQPLDTGTGAYSTKLAHEDGVSADPGLTGRKDTYAAKGTRSVILDYPLEDYQRVTELLAIAREELGVDTNAEAVKGLLDAAHG